MVYELYELKNNDATVFKQTILGKEIFVNKTHQYVIYDDVAITYDEEYTQYKDIVVYTIEDKLVCGVSESE